MLTLFLKRVLIETERSSINLKKIVLYRYNILYWQVSLHPEVQKYTAFVHESRTYQFCVIPFSINISNIAFDQALESLLNVPVENDENYMRNYLHILLYVDNLLVFSTSFVEHIYRLKNLFQKIRQSGMTIQLSKCEFFKHRIKFLGYIITPLGMTMDS